MLIKNGYLLSPADHLDGIFDLRIENDRISEIGVGLPEDKETFDAAGKLVVPGLIDMHVHLRDPGQTQKEDVYSGCKAAAAGGITSLACMPNTNPVLDCPALLYELLSRAKTADAKVYPVGAITCGLQGETLTDMAALKTAGAVAVSDDGRPVKNGRRMLDGMRLADQNRLLTISHCEDLDIIDGGIMHKGTVSGQLAVPGMDRASEDSITAREIALAAAANVPIHIAHVSTAGSIALIRDAKRRGVKVSCETGPHYFSLTEQLLLSRDADYRMNPPLREQTDVEAVKVGIADGTIDCIVTDHAPHTPEEKADFLHAPNGVIGMETSFSASYTYLVKPGIIPLARLIELMSVNPARLLRIPGGTLSVGAVADLAVIDLNRSWTVDPQKLHSKSKNAVYKGMTLQSKIFATFLNGRLVYQDQN